MKIKDQSLWPIGFAISLAAVLIGVVVNWIIFGLGAVGVVVFIFLWKRDLADRPNP